MRIHKRKIIILFALVFFLAGCTNTDSTDEIDSEAAPPVVVPTSETEVMVDYFFVSRDNRLSFEFQEGWFCREVVYGIRVDCYPVERRVEEYDAGLDEDIVLYPNVSMFITDCSATEESMESGVDSRAKRYLKKYGECQVEVIVDDPAINTEERLDEIVIDVFE